jgi:chemotaxis-related protein WspB
MLFLLFELDGDRYALDAAQIAAVLALAPTKSIPGAPAWIAGIVECHGALVPVIDVPRLALGRPAHPLRSTRLVLVDHSATRERRHGGDGASPENRRTEEPRRLIGLILERATRTRRIDRSRFAETGIATPNARWLGPVASEPDGLVQWVDSRQMLDDDMHALLMPGASRACAIDRPW